MSAAGRAGSWDERSELAGPAERDRTRALPSVPRSTRTLGPRRVRRVCRSCAEVVMARPSAGPLTTPQPAANRPLMASSAAWRRRHGSPALTQGFRSAILTRQAGDAVMGELESDTVTLLFTEIEGLTRLLEPLRGS